MTLDTLFRDRSTLGILAVLSFVVLVVPGMAAGAVSLAAFVFFTTFLIWAGFAVLALVRSWGALA